MKVSDFNRFKRSVWLLFLCAIWDETVHRLWLIHFLLVLTEGLPAVCCLEKLFPGRSGTQMGFVASLFSIFFFSYIVVMLTKLAGCLWSWLNSWFCVTWDLTSLSLSPWNRKRLTKRGDVELLLRLVGENKHFLLCNWRRKYSIFTVCCLFLLDLLEINVWIKSRRGG